MADITDIPSYIASVFGVSEFIAGAILSTVIVFGLMAFILVLSKGEDHGISAIVVGLFATIMVTALGWSDVWVLILFITIIGIVAWFMVSKG